jgi:excisionase family DNA binding protein
MKSPRTITVQDTYRTGEAADLIGVHRNTIVRMIECGQLPSRRIKKHRRITHQDLIDYARRWDNPALLERLMDRPHLEPDDLRAIILAILDYEENREGITQDQLREARLPAEMQNQQGNMIFDDLTWTSKTLMNVLLDLRTNHEIALFTPTKGRRKNNGKLHYCLTKYAPIQDETITGKFGIPRL